ncbi:MAG: sel1 repeat family protein, partial [Proteobacteria bacterium]|nr:sel1 repeat family protein [Pseudomonadota bacterium]
VNLGVCYEEGRGVAKDEKEAVSWYRKAAKQGYPEAQNNLGWCYEEGRGVAKDEQKAVNWYRKAAEQRYPEAQVNLGVCYEEGKGVAKDEREAMVWYQKAAEQGNEEAIKRIKGLSMSESFIARNPYTTFHENTVQRRLNDSINYMPLHPNK